MTKHHWIKLCVVALILLGVGGVRSYGQELRTPEGHEIIAVDFDVSPPGDMEAIKAAVRTRVGDIYKTSAIQRDIAALYGLGILADARVEAERVGAKLRLIYRLRRLALVKAITFEGQLDVSEAKLRALIKTGPGKPANPYRLKVDLQALRNYYRDRGYFFAEVTQETHVVAEGVEVAYHVESAKKLRVESVQFEGNEGVPEKELRKIMLSTKPGGLFGGHGKYDPLLLPSDVLAIQELFRRKGYLDATVEHETIFDETKERAYLIVRVTKGPLYRIASIRFSGNKAYESPRLLAVMGLHEGAAFSQDQLDKDVRAMTVLYGSRGYIKARIRTEHTVAEHEPTVTLRVFVGEGVPVFVNRVMIRGNWRTKDHVIRRDVLLEPGSLADLTKVDETKRRLTNTGLFFALDPTLAFREPVSVRFLDTESEELTDVVVEVTEGGMGSFNIGAGWNSTTGIVGRLQLLLKNFDALDFPASWQDFAGGHAWTGGGQSLSLSLTPGTDYRDYRLGWDNPSVWDSPYSTGFDLYATDIGYTGDYEESKVGVSAHVGRRLFGNLRIALVPTVETLDIKNVDDDAPSDVVESEGSHLRHVLALRAAYDKRDNILLTTEGYRLAASVEMGGMALGGDVDFLREGIEARKWWTIWDQEDWGKHVVNVGGELGFIQHTGSGSLPIFERFFIGGIDSLRGFSHQGMGPVDDVYEKHVGGKFQAILNAEYEAPLVRDVLRGVLFVDSGVLERSPSDFTTDRIRAAAGVGIRVRIPQFGMGSVPIGLFISFPLRDEPTDDTEAISFSIGSGIAF